MTESGTWGTTQYTQMKAMADSAVKAVDTFVEAVSPGLTLLREQLTAAFLRISISLRRIQLERQLLEAWWCPFWLAFFVADHCPKRWLPWLDEEKWERVIQRRLGMTTVEWLMICWLCLMVGFGLGMGFVILLDRWHDKEMTRLYRGARLEWKKRSRWTRET